MSIIVDTKKVTNTANDIKKSNDKIHSSSDKLNKKVDSAFSSWEGKASTAFKAYYVKVKKHEDERKIVFENYNKFLLLKVAADYEITEQNNTNLADLFK